MYDVSAVLTSIRSLLGDLNPNFPANNEAAILYVEDKQKYDEKIREIVEYSWI